MDRGPGRLIFLSVPRGLGIDRAAMPVLAQLIAHLTRGLLPVEVSLFSALYAQRDALLLA